VDALAVTVEGVCKKLGPNRALDGVSVRFEAGKLHGLIGPDGAGKTTLLRHLVGLLRPDQGSVRWTAGGRVLPLEAVREQIAYLPQTQSLYGDLSIGEHLDFFRDLYGLDAKLYGQRRAQLLHLTRLDRFVDRPAGKLSGGMYKKLGLMCCLLASPRALLLDEPTNGVDPVSRREFWELLMQLLKQRILIIVATAYMDEAERCDQVHLLSQGRLLAGGEPRRLLKEARADRFDDIFLKAAGMENGAVAFRPGRRP
jgi:ABC-2 type transport system ATP-binding protein